MNITDAQIDNLVNLLDGKSIKFTKSWQNNNHHAINH